MKSNPLLRLFIIVLLATTEVSPAVEASNGYVSVEATGSHVESIVKVGNDFHIVTKDAPQSTKADVTVSGIDPWDLDSDSDFQLGIGESKGWAAHNTDDDEEPGEEGNIILFKVDVEICGVGESKEESDGAWINYHGQYDATDNQYVQIRCYPRNRPDDEKIILTFPDGMLFEVVNGVRIPARTQYRANEISSILFQILGTQASTNENDFSISARHSINGCSDTAKFTVHRINEIVINGDQMVNHGSQYSYSVIVKDQFANLITSRCQFRWTFFNPDASKQDGICSGADGGSASSATWTWMIENGQTTHLATLDPLIGAVLVHATLGTDDVSKSMQIAVHKGTQLFSKNEYFLDVDNSTPPIDVQSAGAPVYFPPHGSAGNPITESRTFTVSVSVSGSVTVSAEAVAKVGLFPNIGAQATVGVSGNLTISGSVTFARTVELSSSPTEGMKYQPYFCKNTHYQSWTLKRHKAYSTGFDEWYGDLGTANSTCEEGSIKYKVETF